LRIVWYKLANARKKVRIAIYICHNCEFISDNCEIKSRTGENKLPPLEWHVTDLNQSFSNIMNRQKKSED